MMQLLLNDLSISDVECSREVAAGRLRVFVKALKEVSRVTPNYVLNGSVALNALSFGSNWPLAALRNAGGCEDENLYLKTIQNRFPFAQTIDALKGPPAEGFEYALPKHALFRSGETAMGLGLAHQFGALAISLATHDFWAEPMIQLEKSTLATSGDIEVEAVNARNASCVENVTFHRESLLTALKRGIFSGSELWVNRELLFPNLLFIPRTRAQIESILHAEPTLGPVIERLSGLNGAIERWKNLGSDYPSYPFNVRGESRSRMALVEFADQDGISRAFSDHADFAPGEGRLHFFLQTVPTRRALIGHVGRKLGIG